ncbi:hypothetical protein [Leucobacter sp. wl10]|uniref:hypothetical protein n=1 Tax=Leucobacter sp. wl10 TaxID=2304677 RepID=UPI001F09A06E|nr:hypothetical protein [Leucobacter sp. wl10]
MSATIASIASNRSTWFSAGTTTSLLAAVTTTIASPLLRASRTNDSAAGEMRRPRRTRSRYLRLNAAARAPAASTRSATPATRERNMCSRFSPRNSAK